MKYSASSLQQAIRQYFPLSRRPNRIDPGLWNIVGRLRIRIIGQPSIVANATIKTALTAMPKDGYYAVHTGHKPGIYRTWPEAEAQVKGFSAAKFKKFPSEAAAQAYMKSSPAPYSVPSRSSSEPKAGQSSSHRQTPQSSHPGAQTRAVSPPTAIDPSLLPPNLQEIAKKGYTFSKDQRLVVYTDGSGLGNGQAGARAGLGVYWGSEGDAGRRNLAERVPGNLQTNNRGELLSVIRAVEECPYPLIPLEIRTDSQYTIGCMTTYLAKWMRTGFRIGTKAAKPFSADDKAGKSSGGQPIKNADLVKHLLVLLRRRTFKAGVRFKYVAGHVGWEGNEAADKLAKRGALMPPLSDRTDWLDPEDDDDVPQHEETERVDVDVEIEESWLLTEEEMYSLERDFKEQDK